MEYKYYVNANEFYKEVVKLIPNFNFNKSLFLVDQSFFIEEEYVFAPYLNMALDEFNKILGKEVFCSNKSQVFNEAYTIFYPLGISELDNPVEVVEAKEEPEEVVEELEELVKVEEVVEPETKEVDWEWVESLKNTKDDKEKLDVYAEGFDVKLNKSNTMANMIKAFKKAL